MIFLNQIEKGLSKVWHRIKRLIELAAWCSIVVHFPEAAAAVTPTLVKDIVPGPSGNAIGSPTSYHGKLLFSANDGVHGYEPWMSDGTDAGTAMLKDIFEGATSSSPGAFIVFGEKVLFYAQTDSAGYELWITDGTDAGTTLVKDINPGPSDSLPIAFFIVGTSVVFIADGGGGRRFWRSDGTADGTQLIPGTMDLTGTTGLLSQPVLHNGAVYGIVVANDQSSAWMYKTDGNTVSLVKDFVDTPGKMISSYGYLYFVDTYSLWRSNGTPAGTEFVANVREHLNPFANANGFLLMCCNAEGWAHTAFELHKWNGASMSLVKDVNPGLPQSRPRFVSTEWRNNIFFQASDPTQQTLWVTDGTTAGTRRYHDFGSGFNSNPGAIIIEDRDYALVVGTTPQHGRELWITYSLDTPPSLLFDLNPGTASSNASPLMQIGNKMYMNADNGVTGSELWVFELPAAAATDWQHFQ